jgi:RNA polymerase sigma-70 factor (ECF subfamily)
MASTTDMHDSSTSLTDEQWREVVTKLGGFVSRRIADPHRAEDLVSEILLRIHQNLTSLDDQDRLLSWVFRIARNAVIDEYRRAGRAREDLVAAPDETEATGPAALEMAEPAALRELAGCMRPLLDNLPPEQHRAVELVDLDGWTQQRAAHEEGVSLPGMKSRVQRGRQRLAELLGQCCALDLDARGVPMDYTPSAGCGPSGGCGCGVPER